MKYIIYFLLFFTSVKAQKLDVFFKKTNSFLNKNVNENGKVDYEYLKINNESLLSILDLVKEIDLEKENLNTKKAFWINVYNLQVIRLVAENNKINSVLTIPNFFSEKKFIIAKKEITLDIIEHDMLRKEKYDPRYHFVLYSASKGGAKLSNNAYLPENLHEQLEKQTKEKINSEGFFSIDLENNTLYLNQFFEWYAKDFKLLFSDITDFLNLYSNVKIKKGFQIKYYDFDWDLN